jgi:hypothetical protein
MRKVKVIVVLIVLVALLGGCALWETIFGPSKNNIMAWWPDDIEVGTQLVYRYTGVYPDNSSDTGTEIWEIMNIDERDTKIVIQTTPGYMIVDDTKGAIAIGDYEYIDESAMTLLKTPVEEGTVWTSDEFLWFGMLDSRYEITATKSTKDFGADLFKDVVVVKITDSFIEDAVALYETYWSPSGGFLGYYIRMKDGWTTGGYKEVRYELDSIE